MEFCRYTAFGLQIDSEIVLPELLQGGEKKADVSIVCSDAPDEMSVLVKKTGYYQANADEFLLRVKGIADYYITNGNKIEMRLFNRANLCEARLYLLGTAMGVLLMQRGFVPIHGSTVVINGCGVVFTGVSGAGKSTMAAALHKNGYSLLADDVSAVMVDQQGIPWIQPGYPQQKLWQAIAAMIGIDTTSLNRVCEERDKYIIPLLNGFRKLPVPLNAIYEINVNPCDDVTIVPVSSIEKLAVIMNNTYRVQLISDKKLKIAHFQKCTKLLKHVQIFRLTRPEKGMAVDRQIELLLKNFTA